MSRRRFNQIRLGRYCLESRIVPSNFVEVESNNTVALANNVTVPTDDVMSVGTIDWLNIQATIDYVADRDFFRFTIGQPATLFFDVDANPTLDAVLDVYDSTGQVLIGSNNQGYDFDSFIPPSTPVSSAASSDPSLVLNLAVGTYLARVTPFTDSSTGDYQLRILADGGTTANTPSYSSRPGAAATLFLDFDGNSATDDWGTYSVGSFDLNGQSSSFSAAERMAINNIWRIVAEDFAPFDVNVTTVDPGSFSNGVAYRVVVTNSPPSAIGLSGAPRGAAVAGSFSGPATNTGFVFANSFSDYLGGISGRIVAAAIEQANEVSRQFGVAIGLRNFGGVNAQPIGIMQSPDSGLSRATWSAGLTHSGEIPVTFQDDVAALTTSDGLAYLPDDHGDTLATATIMSTNAITGLIGNRTTDKDVFRFAAMQGDYTIHISVDPFAGNLDVQMRAFNSLGQLLVSNDPDNSFGLTYTFYIPSAGNYYLEVSSHGQPGAIGNYKLDYVSNPVNEPAHVTSGMINGGAIQRSMVTQLDFRFSRPLTFPNGAAAAFHLDGPSGLVPVDVDLAGSTPSQTLVHVQFPNGMGGFGSISDGKYTMTLVAANILDDGLNQLDGDNNGQPGGNYVLPLHRLYGDINGDRAVTSADFALFRSVFGAGGTTGTAFAADYNGDGVVNSNDFAQFRLRFGQIIP